MKIASTRDGPCADGGFLSAQVNCGVSLPVHKDKNNHGEIWLIGLGDCGWWKVVDREPFGPASTTNYYPTRGRSLSEETT